MPLTQVDIDADIHQRAKTYAADNRTTMKALVNEGLSDLLKRKATASKHPAAKGRKGL